MLRDAALLQLDLIEAAIKEGMTLKDATPYNVQFVSGRPVFIDIPSFETLLAGAPWTGYRQFCEMFLFPLMLQAKLDSRYGSTSQNVRSELKSAGFNKEMILANIRKMRKLVSKLSWQGDGSEWGSYEEFHNYSEDDHLLKESFIEECVAASEANLVWDIGCNTGQFSKIAANNARQVVAMDLDHFAVERLYREIKAEGVDNILTLVQNVADPSPNWGWRNSERTDLKTRARPDLVLCLALIHHVVISANIPLEEFIGWLADASDQLVMEYVSRSDDKVEALLRNKEDKYSDYSRQNLERTLERHYGIVRQLSLESGNRFLYWCRKTDSSI